VLLIDPEATAAMQAVGAIQEAVPKQGCRLLCFAFVFMSSPRHW